MAWGVWAVSGAAVVLQRRARRRTSPRTHSTVILGYRAVPPIVDHMDLNLQLLPQAVCVCHGRLVGTLCVAPEHAADMESLSSHLNTVSKLQIVKTPTQHGTDEAEKVGS